MNTRNSSCTYS